MSTGYEIDGPYDEGWSHAKAEIRAELETLKTQIADALTLLEQLPNARADAARLKALIALYDGVKWRDAGPLADLRPEDEKYITRDGLIRAIDKRLKDQT